MRIKTSVERGIIFGRGEGKEREQRRGEEGVSSGSGNDFFRKKVLIKERIFTER